MSWNAVDCDDLHIILNFVMPIYIRDSELEERLERLGQAQSVPVNKHAMVVAILKAATKDLRKPQAWRGQEQPNGSEAA